MACIEIKVKNQVFRILNDDPKSEVFHTSDWDLIKNFLQHGELPVGYWVEGDVNRDEVFDHILGLLASSPTNKNLFISTLSGETSRKEFINKFVGQYEYNLALDWDRKYNSDKLDKNVFVSEDWSYDKNWYGFTEERALLLTGNKNFDKDRKTKILYTAYIDIKNGDSRVISLVNNLSEKYGLKADIYSNLTTLANEHLSETVAVLFTPFNSKEELTKEEVKKGLKEATSKYVGKIVRHLDSSYIIKSRNDDKTISAINVETNKIENIPISYINSIYNPFTLFLEGSEYMLIGKEWYKIDKGRFIKINDQVKEQLFLNWFGITGEETSLNFYAGGSSKKSKYKNSQSPVYVNTEIDGVELESILPERTRIRTSSGMFIKTNGEFMNNDYSLTNKEQIHEIILPNNNPELVQTIMKLKTVESNENTLNKEELQVVLHDLFNVEDFSDIWFNNKQEELVRVSYVLINNEYTPIVQIGTRNSAKINEETYSKLKLALNYYNYLKDNSTEKLEEVSNPKNFWSVLINNVFGDKTVEVSEQVQEVINFLKNDINDSTDGEVLVDVLNNNKEKLYKTYQATDEEIDAFIKELIDKGLYIISCEL